MKAIIEIGPISDYIENSRKTKDLWGSSFLFSLVMGKLTKLILEKEIPGFNTNMENFDKIKKVIVRPYLKKDILFQNICELSLGKQISAGSIPDRIYLNLTNFKDLNLIQEKYYEIISDLFDSIIKIIKSSYRVEEKKDYEKITFSQIRDLFRIFFVYCEDSEGDHVKLEKEILSRYGVFPFDHLKHDPIDKYDRCSLCGDRERIISIKMQDSVEKLCTICVIKRGLLDYFQYNNIWIKRFFSTTEISAKIHKHILANNKEKITDSSEWKDFIRSHIEKNDLINDDIGPNKVIQIIEILKEPNNFDSLLENISFRFLFSSDKNSIELRKIIYKKVSEQEKIWIDNHYVALLQTDGDNIGSLLTIFEENNLLDEASEAINNYTNSVNGILQQSQGQLIFCGGEDLLAIIHPTDLFDVIEKIHDAFINSFRISLKSLNDDDFKKICGNRNISLSAGAVIFKHNFPFKLALNVSERMLSEAKKIPGKGSLAVSIIKSASPKSSITLKIVDDGLNYSLGDFRKLLKEFYNDNISRGFVYKLKEEYNVMSKVIENNEEMKKYFIETLNKSKEIKNKVEINTILSGLIDKKASYEKNNGCNTFLYEKIINILYFARFLTGEK